MPEPQVISPQRQAPYRDILTLVPQPIRRDLIKPTSPHSSPNSPLMAPLSIGILLGYEETGSGDDDIINANIASGVQLENLSISGSFTSATCTTTVQGTCEADSACRWTGAACERSTLLISNQASPFLALQE